VNVGVAGQIRGYILAKFLEFTEKGPGLLKSVFILLSLERHLNSEIIKLSR
jgi:hypothetical protein